MGKFRKQIKLSCLSFSIYGQYNYLSICGSSTCLILSNQRLTVNIANSSQSRDIVLTHWSTEGWAVFYFNVIGYRTTYYISKCRWRCEKMGWLIEGAFHYFCLLSSSSSSSSSLSYQLLHHHHQWYPLRGFLFLKVIFSTSFSSHCSHLLCGIIIRKKDGFNCWNLVQDTCCLSAQCLNLHFCIFHHPWPV